MGWECPYTRWDSENIEVEKAQSEARKAAKCPLEIRASASENETSYFRENSDKIREQLLKHGAIWFRGFELMKDVKGYREMHEAWDSIRASIRYIAQVYGNSLVRGTHCM